VLFLATAAVADRWSPSDRFKLVGVTDPQISPDGKSVAVVVSRANLKDNRNETEIVAVDIAGGTVRPLTFERRGVASPRWSPDGSQMAYVTADEAEKADKNNKSFEIDDDDFLVSAAPTPSHLWLIAPDGGAARRLTSGAWSLPVAHPPGPAPSPLSWSSDGKSIAITRRETAHAGTPNVSRVALVDAATGEVRRLTSSDLDEGQPVFSPDGTRVTYWQARGARRGNATAIWSVPASGGNGLEVTAPLDRNVFRSIWLPNGKSFLTAAHEGTSTTYYVVTLDGNARRLDLGELDPTHAYWPDASVSRNGVIAFTASTPTHPRDRHV